MKTLIALRRPLTILSILLTTQAACSRIPKDGTVIKSSTGQIYLIDGRHRRQIPDTHSLLAYGLGKAVVQTLDEKVDAIALGPPLPSVPSAFIRNSAGEVFHLEAGKRRQLDITKAVAANYPGATVMGLPDSKIESIPLGTPITEFEKVILQRERAYDLKIVGISPNRALLEHGAMQVRYQLDVREIGLTGDLTPARLKGSVCPAVSGNCIPIPELQPNQTFTGELNTFAPSAASAAAVNIKLVGEAACSPCETILAVSEDSFVPVAARYEIAIESFFADKLRSKFTDTVKISLRSGLQGSPLGASFCQVVGGNFCRVNVAQGDVGAFTVVAMAAAIPNPRTVNNVRVGSFDLIPEVSDNVVFQYDVENLGHEKTEVLNSLSQAAGGILDALVQHQNIDTLGGFASKIVGLEGCDGTVAVDGKLILNKSDANLPGVPTLDSLTRDNGHFTPRFTQFEGTDSAIGCGGNSRYQVTWSIIRTSWQP